MNASESDRLITAVDLVNGDVLSFKDQPFLQTLIQDMQGGVPLTLIVGAGVSMESGLPSWKELVNRLIGELDAKGVGDFVQKADIDLLRRAGVAVNLLELEGKNQLGSMLRKALFPENSLVEPGPLAGSIARIVALCMERQSKIRIITTNYDTLLEEAIKVYTRQKVPSFSLKQVNRWREYNDSGKLSVLHVHGVVGQGGDPQEPIVLAEVEFMRYGAEVRKVIAENLLDSVGLLIGLSITDPNIIGPLYETRSQHQQFHRYALAVAGPVLSDADNVRNAARYHVESARYLKNLGLDTVLLRSFSQLNQVVSDLALAIRQPGRYMEQPDDGGHSLIYEKRFGRILSLVYGEIGCRAEPYVPTGEVAEQMTKRLRKAIENPKKYLNKKINEYMEADAPYTPENFQLCLWLRTQDYVENREATYSLEFMGSSTFQNFDAWALRRDVPIKHASPFAAAQAVFRGTTVCTNLDPQTYAGGLWKGVLAIPIRLGFKASGLLAKDHLDQLTIGALTLDSTRYVANRHLDNMNLPEEELGIVAKLRRPDFKMLTNLLYDAVPLVLFGP